MFNVILFELWFMVLCLAKHRFRYVLYNMYK